MDGWRGENEERDGRKRRNRSVSRAEVGRVVKERELSLTAGTGKDGWLRSNFDARGTRGLIREDRKFSHPSVHSPIGSKSRLTYTIIDGQLYSRPTPCISCAVNRVPWTVRNHPRQRDIDTRQNNIEIRLDKHRSY